MEKAHFDKYLSQEYELRATETHGDTIFSGQLLSKRCKRIVNIIGGIPRFVSTNNYADNFSLQWNKFKSTQLDSASNIPLTAKRFWSNTQWSSEELSGKTVLEVGSGAGRFTEILLQAGAVVVSFDYSNAVTANYDNNKDKGDLFVFQGDLYDIPLQDESFDYVFCYGVLQHTPDPLRAYRAIYLKLRHGGKISIDYYKKMRIPSPWSTPKYIWRPITSRMKPDTLLKIIETYMPLYLPLDTAIRRIPRIGSKIIALIPIPCWNYIDIGLEEKQRLEWAIMDTFDALGAKYDTPKTLKEVTEMVDSPENKEVSVFYGSNGVVANVLKADAKDEP